MLLGLLGWGLGVLLGGPAGERLVAVLSQRLLPVEYDPPFASIVITLAAVVVVAFVASIGPSLAAARMRIAEILRYA
jgi:ABC-type antimicrobial peptide transport system permease subunit